MKNVFVIVLKTEQREWGAISFEVKGAYPSFEAAKKALLKKKQQIDESRVKCADAPTSTIETVDEWANWFYRDWDGRYDYRIEKIQYHDENE